MKIVLMHGKDADPTQKWYPWLSEVMKKEGNDFIAPVLPNASDPVLSEWMHELDQIDIDQDTILVGHSRGGVALLRWLEKQAANFKVKKVILIATNSGNIGDMAITTETNHGFYTEEGYDLEKIKSHCTNFVVLHSTDDQWVPFSHGEKIAKGLNAKFLEFNDYGHFGKTVPEIPELLLEIDN